MQIPAVSHQSHWSRWCVYVGFSGRVARIKCLSAKVFAEAEARRLRETYPDSAAEFWVSNASFRPTASWAGIELRLKTVDPSGIDKQIFDGSTKKTAHRRMSVAVSKAIKDTVAQHRIDTYVSCLPYTINKLMDYISTRFKPGMSWNNFGSEWVIDHIKPRAAFDMRDPVQLMKCWELSNLQPLWSYENNSKGMSDKSYVHRVG